MVTQVTQELQSQGVSKPNLEVMLLDLADLASVRRFAEQWRKQNRPLHILVNNAGLYNMTGTRGSKEGSQLVNTSSMCISFEWVVVE
jgi:NAD(P)-dependent dehydrogenase (short-subunit alcohol dehydrogenase family)